MVSAEIKCDQASRASRRPPRAGRLASAEPDESPPATADFAGRGPTKASRASGKNMAASSASFHFGGWLRLIAAAAQRVGAMMAIAANANADVLGQRSKRSLFFMISAAGLMHVTLPDQLSAKAQALATGGGQTGRL